jgi:hypothetical protein
MKLEIENEEIANAGAAFCWRTRLNVLECAHCRSLTETVHIPVTVDCPNLRSAWSQEILTYADGSPIPIVIDVYRCYCEGCLKARRTADESTPPAPYQGSNRRCRICGAVDSVPYPKFLSSLTASNRSENCELYRGLCNRPVCKWNRRFQGEIPDVPRTHNKGSYPSGFSKTNWVSDPSEISIHPDLIDWAQNQLPSNGNSLSGWGRNSCYGTKIEYTIEPLQPQTEMLWKDEQGKWKDLAIATKGMSQLDFGDNRKPRARECAEESRLYAYQRRHYYNSDPKTLAEYRELMLAGNPRTEVKAVGSWLWIIVGGLNPTLEEVIAKQYDEKHSQKHPDKDDMAYLPRPAAYGETLGGVKESDEPLSEFYAQWAAKLNPGGWDWQNATLEQKATILGNPEFKRALYQLLIRTSVARVNELEPEKNPNAVAQWVRRELQNPLDSISEKDLANTAGRLGFAVTLNNRARVKVIVPHDAPMSQILSTLNKEKTKSITTATKNAKQDARRERLGKRATKDAINDAVRRVEQAYNDAENGVKFLYANSSTTNELQPNADADVTFSTIGEGE